MHVRLQGPGCKNHFSSTEGHKEADVVSRLDNLEGALRLGGLEIIAHPAHAV